MEAAPSPRLQWRETMAKKTRKSGKQLCSMLLSISHLPPLYMRSFSAESLPTCSSPWQSARPRDHRCPSLHHRHRCSLSYRTIQANIATSTSSAQTMHYSAGADCGTSAQTLDILPPTHHRDCLSFPQAQRHTTLPSHH